MLSFEKGKSKIFEAVDHAKFMKEKEQQKVDLKSNKSIEVIFKDAIEK